eukprot:m.357235 g.357235  ORF g.357235 m.357235 type:complete len:67 (-) comp28025_c0_seq11:48-248(-)
MCDAQEYKCVYGRNTSDYAPLYGSQSRINCFAIMLGKRSVLDSSMPVIGDVAYFSNHFSIASLSYV